MIAIGAIAAFSLSSCANKKSPDPKPGGPKRVIVDKTVQKLSAYEGERLVIESRVSTGQQGRRTPSGNFRAGYKERMHYSTLYDNAPMPWSVQVNGNYFIHGYTSVPDFPASHGCIRMPLDGDNPAKRFYDWVEKGTPIRVTGEWAGKPAVMEKRVAVVKPATVVRREGVLKPAAVRTR
jgi:lipoprotein-anchoring transpeptidase ErfK/SrfK